jgi:2-octaprenyl-6-methoxyphenol hydroxylase
MKLCIIGDGLVSLTLAKALVNNGIYVDVFSNQKLKKFDKTRTIGISKSNFDFINKKIINIKKLSWRIDEIKIFNRTINKEEILNFKDIKNHLFFMIKNFELIDYLIKELNSNKFFKLKKKHDINKILKLNYNLIINCENNNFITKKFFFKKIIKDYKSIAYATIIEHKKKKDNHTATQIFTERGPLAFLPLSEFETSIVYSARGLRNLNLKELIRKYNSKYSITKIHESSNLALKAINLRSYYHNNILAFGDLLHRLHPLAGQGFNMSIRDINILLDLI